MVGPVLPRDAASRDGRRPRAAGARRAAYAGAVTPRPPSDCSRSAACASTTPVRCSTCCPSRAGWPGRSDGEGLVGWGEAARVELHGGPTASPRPRRGGTSVVARAEVDDEVGAARQRPRGLRLVRLRPGAPVGAGRPRGRRRAPRRPLVGHHRRRRPRACCRRASAPGRRASVRFADGSRRAPTWAQVVADAVAASGPASSTRWCSPATSRPAADAPVDVRWPLRRLAARLPRLLDLLRRRAARRDPRDAGAAAGRRRHLAACWPAPCAAAATPTRDLRKSDALARSIKDLEEHGYGVRSVADALARHCSDVDVPDAPFVLDLPNVMHLATDVRGVVADGATVARAGRRRCTRRRRSAARPRAGACE